MKLSAQIPAAAIDEECVFRGYLLGPEKRQSNHPAGRRRPGAARRLADLAGPLRYLVALDWRDIGVRAKTEQLATHLAHVGPARHDFLADVTSLREAQREIR